MTLLKAFGNKAQNSTLDIDSPWGSTAGQTAATRLTVNLAVWTLIDDMQFHASQLVLCIKMRKFDGCNATRKSFHRRVRPRQPSPFGSAKQFGRQVANADESSARWTT